MRFVMLAVLIDMLAVGLVIPVLPALVGTFSADPADQARSYGVVTFSFAAASFVGAPILGALSDRFGRRPILLVGFCGIAINFFMTALASAFWMLVVSRLFGGGMQANAAVANAYVADITPPEQRARRFGMLGAMFGIGFILGPVVGGILGGIEIHLPFFVAGGLALLNLAYGIFILPESLPAEQRRALQWGSLNPFKSLRELTELKGVGLLAAVMACSALAQFTLYIIWVLYFTQRFQWGPSENGWALFAVGLVSALVQGVLLGRLLKRFSARRLAVMGLLSSSLAFVAFGLATQGWMVYAIVAANLLGSTVAASLQSLVSGAADGSNQGRTMGAVSALNGLMAVLAPMLAAPLLAAVSHFPGGDWRVGLPMFSCALLQALALLLAVTHFSRSRRGRVAVPAA